MKPTARRRSGRTGYVAGEDDPPPPTVRLDAGHGGEERERVGMERLGVEPRGGRLFNDPPEVHHGHVVRHILHDRKIVRDEEVGESQLLPQFHEQVHHLRLDRDVERRDRLVEHEEVGLDHDRAGDGDPLPLATGKLVRVAVERRRGEPGAGQRASHPFEPLGRRAQPVDDEAFFKDRADFHPGIERAVRILEDDLHPPPQPAHLGAAGSQHVATVEPHTATRGLHQSQEAAADRGLTTAALANEPERAALLDREAHAVDGADGPDHAAQQPLPHGKMGLKTRDIDER